MKSFKLLLNLWLGPFDWFILVKFNPLQSISVQISSFGQLQSPFNPLRSIQPILDQLGLKLIFFFLILGSNLKFLLLKSNNNFELRSVKFYSIWVEIFSCGLKIQKKKKKKKRY